MRVRLLPSRHVGGTWIFACLFPLACGQSSNVTCGSSMDWAKNAMGQDPCTVGAFAFDCGNSLVITPLGPGTVYAGPGPTTETASPCVCNSVTYSLMAACGMCQTHNAQSYNDWMQWCNGTNGPYYESYPELTPEGTTFPPWSYLPVPNNMWNSENAIQNASYVASKASASTASVMTLSSLIAASTSYAARLSSLDALQASSTSTSSSTSSSSLKSNTGAIAGGVVGGIAAVALLLGFGALLLRRKKMALKNKNASHSAAVEHAAPQPPSITSNVRYDPNDPRTYPDGSASDGHVDSQGILSHKMSQRGPGPVGAGGYTGAPEL